MNIVYIVTSGVDYRIIAVFSTEEKAQEYVLREISNGNYYYIEVYDVDEIEEN